MREKLKASYVSGPMVFLLLAVTGVIYLGVATPTEASAIGAVGALLLVVGQRKLNFETMRKSLVTAASTTCMILLIVIGAKVFGYFITLTQTTQAIVGYIEHAELSRWVVLLLILLIYMLLGCLMDQIAILILTIPVVLPVIVTLGFDPIWFGVVVIVLAEVGMVTPPVGLNVFVVARFSGRPLEEIFAGVWPHVVAHLLLVVVLCAFPALVLWLPSTMK